MQSAAALCSQGCDHSKYDVKYSYIETIVLRHVQQTYVLLVACC